MVVNTHGQTQSEQSAAAKSELQVHKRIREGVQTRSGKFAVPPDDWIGQA